MINTLLEPQLDDLESLSEIFNTYRVFYHQESDIDLARNFIYERLTQKDSKFFIKKDESNKVIGFIQLYPTFSSVSAGKAWILNDLYVHRENRRQGVAEQLMQQAIEFGKNTNAKYIALETHFDNFPAQTLYKNMGFVEQDKTKLFEFSY